MYWADDTALRGSDWWSAPLWDHGGAAGPAVGALLDALRPMIRAALLLGYQVESVNYGEGRAPSAALAWRILGRETPEWRPAEGESPAKPFAGPNVWLVVTAITDLCDEGDGSYAVPVTIPFLGTASFDRTAFLTAVAVGAGQLVGAAVNALLPHAPALPREPGKGLLWIFDPDHWDELAGVLPPADSAPAVLTWRANPERFLRGQLTGDRAEQTLDGSDHGPPSLAFVTGDLDGQEPRAWMKAFGDETAAAVQARGEAHRWLPPERTLLTANAGPPLLDLLTRMLVTGVLLVDGLVEPIEPIEPIQADTLPDGDITLSVWDGDATVTLHRATVFDGGNRGLAGSVAWDYVTGDAQQAPTVLLVAGRGVLITQAVTTGPARPWRLEIYRVQDDAQVQKLGAVIDPGQLLVTVPIDPYDFEFDPGVDELDTASFGTVVSKPTPTGIVLQYPVFGGEIPEHTGPLALGSPVPRVVELIVPENSGTAAYSIDAHYYTITGGIPSFTTGGVHLSVWVTSGVTVRTNGLPAGSEAAPGVPASAVSGVWTDANMFVAEFWRTDRPNRLARPWSTELPVTDWELLFPGDSGLGPDLFPDVPMPAKLAAVPRLDYDPNFGEAAFTGGVTLTPATVEADAAFGYVDSLLFDVVDVLLGFLPIVGDVSDIAEAAHAWQAGRDKWGRPVDNFTLGMLTLGACMPVVSSGLLVHVANLLRAIPPETADAARRLFRAADGAADFPLQEAQKALGLPGAAEALGRLPGPDDRRLAESLLTHLGEQSGSLEGLAQRLVGVRSKSWLTADDLLSEDGGGFLSSALHTAYTRCLRDAEVSPQEFLGVVDGAG